MEYTGIGEVYVKAIGNSFQRKEAWNKVTGMAKYTDDYIDPKMLHAKILTSTYAHAIIKNIDISGAKASKSVRAVVIGEDYPIRTGTMLEDRPPIAYGKVRYYGEPLAVVVADTERDAERAINMIKVEYEPLPIINSASQALEEDAPIIHEALSYYKKRVQDVYPELGTNIANKVKIRKGDTKSGFASSDVIVEANYELHSSDHVAMETRTAKAEILPNGIIRIQTSSQAPFEIKKQIGDLFKIDQSKIIVEVPLVGGGFGGKTPLNLELIAYIASKSVNGRLVRVANSREQDFMTAPGRMGLEAKIKLGASKDGRIKAGEFVFMLDTGAYADISPRLAKAIAVDCTGPYHIDHIYCDSLCVYTNHTYVTAFRGFSHESFTFCIERALDKLAIQLQIDPLKLRLINAISPGNTSPTQVHVTKSNVGNIAMCIRKLEKIMKWEEGKHIRIDRNSIRSKGISCFWKISNSATDAISGVVLIFNGDGTLNLICGAVEYGQNVKTMLAQILAEKMKMSVNRIHVSMEVDTQYSPEHWKTVASLTTYMVGNAVLRAAEDLIDQLKKTASIILKCTEESLDIAEEKVFVKDNPMEYVVFKDIVHGYRYKNGNSIGGPIIGKGKFIMNNLTILDQETGQGKPGQAWTVGAQAVEVEYNQKEHTYRILKAATVIDAGKVINPKNAECLIKGGMSMGLGLASRESFIYDSEGKNQNTSLRTYKVLHYGEQPRYQVEFIETPQIDVPFGARGLGEHGIIGMAGALANALSTAAEVELNQLPITPESIWKAKRGKEHDTI